MSANAFIGVHVTVTLHNGNIVSGTITNVDLSRNALLLKTDTNGKIATLDRSRIASLSTTPAPAAVETAQASSSSSSSSATAYDSAPDVAHLPTPSSGHSVVGGGGKLSNKAAKNNGKGGKKSSKRNASASAAASTTPPPPMEDFDFEASAKSFDKAKIWEQIRAQDQSDPAGLLVSHNRRSAGAEEGGIGRSASPAVGGMMRKLRPDENVLSPDEAAGEGVAAAARPTAAGATTATTSTHAHALERENVLLKRRIHILQSLSGLTLDAEEDQQRSPAHDDALVSLRCTATTSVKDQHLAFTLLSSLEQHDSKIRFKPSDGGAAAAAALPEKYNREMGLRLDNGSARVFLERLRAAVAEGQQQQQ